MNVVLSGGREAVITTTTYPDGTKEASAEISITGKYFKGGNKVTIYGSDLAKLKAAAGVDRINITENLTLTSLEKKPVSIDWKHWWRWSNLVKIFSKRETVTKTYSYRVYADSADLSAGNRLSLARYNETDNSIGKVVGKNIKVTRRGDTSFTLKDEGSYKLF